MTGLKPEPIEEFIARQTILMRHLRRFKCFIAVADHLHFRKAADAMHLTQPALSQQIRELESELGAPLFIRDRKSVELTAAGQRFLPAAREAVRMIEEAAEDVGRLVRESETTLRLGYLEYLNLPLPLRALTELRGQRPDIAVQIKHVSPSDVERAIRDDEIDLGIGFLPTQDEDMAARSVQKGEWMLALREDSSLASSHTIPISAMADQPLIVFDREVNPRLYDHLVGQFRQNGVDPQIAHHVMQLSAGPSYVEQGLGAFVHASYVLSELPAGIVRRPIADLAPLELGLVWHGSRRTVATRAFLDVTRQMKS